MSFQSDIVDLRSDTVTRPSAEMYEAMAKAELGDDVLGDDPTVAELEQLAAKMLGKEAGVFTPSGTMANQIGIAASTSPGDVILVEEDAHVFYYEVGGPAMLSNVLTRTLPSRMGTMHPDRVEAAIMKASLHTPGTRLLCVENTHNRAGGTVIPLETQLEYRNICDHHGLRMHLDGARLFNAAVASGEKASTLAAPYDTVSICLSKGLRAPVGSVLAGDEATIEKARLWRKRLGGGMRQSGLLAACGIVALTRMVDRLAGDHARARQFAHEIASVNGLSVDWETIQTNMVIVDTAGPSDPWLARLREQGVWALPPGPTRIRFVFHADINDEKMNRAVEVIRSVSEG